MLVVATFVVVLVFMGIVVAVSMSGDKKRRAMSPPPVPRPVPRDLPTGIHLRWDNRPTGPNPSPYERPPDRGMAGSGVSPAVDAAFAALARGDHRRAAELFREVLATPPAGVSVAVLRFHLAQSLVEIGGFVEADAVLDAALAQLDAPIEGDLLCKRGEIAWAAGELDRAAMLIEAAATRARNFTDSSWIELHLGLVQRDRGRLDEARRLVESALASHDHEADPQSEALVHVLLASVFVEAGALDDAQQQLETAARLVPSDDFLVAYGRIVAAHLARVRRDADRAVALATAARDALHALDLPSYLAEADLELARCHAAAGQPGDAKAAYWRALWGYDSCGCPLIVERIRAEMAELG